MTQGARLAEAMSVVTGYSMADLRSPSRARHLAWVRFWIIWRLRHDMQWSLPRIGVFLSRDHTTIMSALERKPALYEADARFRDVFDSLEAELRNKTALFIRHGAWSPEFRSSRGAA